MTPELLYFVLLQVSLFALGASAVAVSVLVRHRPRRWWAYALTKVGLAGIVGTLMLRVWDNGTVEPSGAAYFYVGFVLASAIGLSYVSGDLARRGGAESAAKVVEETVRGAE